MTQRDTLLLLGGGFADIPLILSAQKLGYRVVTTGNRPQDAGHKLSDDYREADFSDKEAMLTLAAETDAKAICAGCNDFAALSAAHVAEQLGLPGHDPYETALTLHHKDKYRAFAKQYDIASPHAESFSDVESALTRLSEFQLPVIIKPVDLTGGKGISTIHSPEAARPALEAAFAISRAGRVVVEEFLVGSRHGYSAFIVDGRVVFEFSDNEHYFLNPFMVSAASTPSTVAPDVISKLRSSTEFIAEQLSLKTGIFHVQYILHADEPVIIEVCRRAPGDLYIRLVEHATGVDYPEWIVRAAAGLDCKALGPAASRGYFTRHCVMSAKSGRVRSVEFNSSIAENVIDRVMWWTEGDQIEDVMTAKMGIVFLSFQSQAEMQDKTTRMQDLIRVHVD